MNKRLPLLLSLLGIILLAASTAYWILQLYQPPQRPIAAAPHAGMPDPSPDAAAMLFGGQPAAATVTNYQLTGVVAAGHDSVAIIVAEGAPPKALKVGHELAPGVKLAEVYPRYVMLSDGGVMKRIDLAPDAKAAAPMGGAPVVGAPGGAPGSNVQPNMQPGMQLPAQQPAAPPLTAPPPETTQTPVGNMQGQGQDQATTPEPPMAPGAVVPQQQNQQNQPNQAPGNPNMPSQPPARTTGAPVSGSPVNQ